VDPRRFRRLVVKVGSSLLVDAAGDIDTAWLDALARDIALLREHGLDVLVVSSGSIALGCRAAGFERRRAKLDELQAAAAIGQVALARRYSDVFETYGIRTAQILLTMDDTENRRRYLNARGTLACLMRTAVVPVINENDTVATDEIRYGDNDRLAARVAELVMADGLVLLSDVDGLYDRDPSQHADARHLPRVDTIDDAIVSMAGETCSDVGTGGMASKIVAAQMATRAGCTTIIADGREQRPLQRLADGARSTVFPAAATPKDARRRWLTGSLSVNGELRVDDGAVAALRDGNSLLPVGVVDVSGEFQRGDVVSLVDRDGREFGRGLAGYSAIESRKLLGCRSEDIEYRIGYRGRSVLVHRDDMVVFRD